MASSVAPNGWAPPENWPAMATIQLFVHAWDAKANSWNSEPIAFTQSIVTPRKLVNGSLFMLATTEARETWNAAGERLPPGKYMIKAYLDPEETLAHDPTRMLNTGKPVASAEITAEWNEGFKNAQVVSGESFH